MASETDAKYQRRVMAFVQANQSESIKLLAYANPEPLETEYQEVRMTAHGGETPPIKNLSRVNMVDRMSHTLRNLTALLTIAEDAKRAVETSAPAHGGVFFDSNTGGFVYGNDSAVQLEKANVKRWEAENPAVPFPRARFTKIQPQTVGSFISDLRKELFVAFPETVDKMYSVIRSGKNSFSYSTIDVEPVLADGEVVTAMINRVQQIILSQGNTYDNLQNYLTKGWLTTKDKKGNSAKVWPPRMTRLLTKTLAKVSKDRSTLYTTSKKMDVGTRDEFLKQLRNLANAFRDWELNVGISNTGIDDDKLIDSFMAIDMDRIYDEFLDLFFNSDVNAQKSMISNTVQFAESLGCDQYLLKLDEYQLFLRREGSFDAKRAFAEAARGIKVGGKTYVTPSFIDLFFHIVSENELLNDKEASRKKIPIELEMVLISNFGEQLFSIASVGDGKTAPLVLSEEAYASIRDADLRRAYARRHSENSGYVQEFTMRFKSWVVKTGNMKQPAEEQFAPQIKAAYGKIAIARGLFDDSIEARRTADKKTVSKDKNAKKAAQNPKPESKRGAKPLSSQYRNTVSPVRGVQTSSPKVRQFQMNANDFDFDNMDDGDYSTNEPIIPVNVKKTSPPVGFTQRSSVEKKRSPSPKQSPQTASPARGPASRRSSSHASPDDAFKAPFVPEIVNHRTEEVTEEDF